MKSTPAGYREVFLNPGEHHVGGRETRISTLLGSCIAVTMWHPARLVGGMCHFLVPERGEKRGGGLDGRYGREAILMLLRDAVAADTDPGTCQFKVFGGGNMFPGLSMAEQRDVGERNIACVDHILGALGHSIEAHHVGGYGHRNVVFDVWSGEVWIRHQACEPAEGTHPGPAEETRRTGERRNGRGAAAAFSG